MAPVAEQAGHQRQLQHQKKRAAERPARPRLPCVAPPTPVRAPGQRTRAAETLPPPPRRAARISAHTSAPGTNSPSARSRRQKLQAGANGFSARAAASSGDSGAAACAATPRTVGRTAPLNVHLIAVARPHTPVVRRDECIARAAVFKGAGGFPAGPQRAPFTSPLPCAGPHPWPRWAATQDRPTRDPGRRFRRYPSAACDSGGRLRRFRAAHSRQAAAGTAMEWIIHPEESDVPSANGGRWPDP